MSLAIIMDTETTGFDDPDVIELAHTEPYEFGAEYTTIACFRFKPRKQISFGAMATHHILPLYLDDCPEWSGVWAPPYDTVYAIGHNIDFDAKAAALSDSIKRICTLALARRYLPDADSHSLGPLTYYLASLEADSLIAMGNARLLLKNAHSAEIDVALTHKLLEALLSRITPAVWNWEQLYQASELARIPERLGFGKYGPHEAWAKANGGKGMLCSAVRSFDPGYFSWLMSKCDQVRDDPYLRQALAGTN